MKHIDSVSKVVNADLTLLQKEKPNDFSALRNMGTARRWSITLNPKHPNFRYHDHDDLIACLYNYCVTNNLTACLSPLHDQDLLASGDPEEAHYHFFTVSKASRKSEMIASLSYFLNGFLPPIKPVGNEFGYFRYFAHQDNPEKAQYNPDDIVCINGYTPPSCGVQSSTEELLDLTQQFSDIHSLTSYVFEYRRDLANALLRFNKLINSYYTGRFTYFG